jgi:hypothetical protein
MTEGAFEDGYRAGWESVAGAAPLPAELTQPPDGSPRDHQHGFESGRADALEEFQPGRAGGPAMASPKLELVLNGPGPSERDCGLGDMGRGSREETHGGR